MTYISRYLGTRSLEEVLSSPEEFDKVLDKVVGVALERAFVQLPKLIVNHAKGTEATRKMIDDFYQTNRDLKPYKSMVATEVTRLCSESPDLNMGEVLVKVAEIVRGKVGLNTKH